MNVAGERTLFGRVVVWCQAVLQATRSYDYRTSKFEYFAHIHGGPRRLAATTTFQGWGRKERGACKRPNSLHFPNNVQLQEMVNQITMPAYTQKVLL